MSVDTSVEVSGVSGECRLSVDGDLDIRDALTLSRCRECRVSSVERCRAVSTVSTVSMVSID